MCGMVRRKPKFTPEASSIMLFGPAFTDVVKAKIIRVTKNISRHAGLRKVQAHTRKHRMRRQTLGRLRALSNACLAWPLHRD